MHGLYGSPENIYLIYLIIVYHGYGIGDGMGLDEYFQFRTFIRRHKFTIIEHWMIEISWEYHRGREYGAGIAPATGLIAARFNQFILEIGL